jgi:hypothetical protein
MQDEYETIIDLSQRYPGIAFRNADAIQQGEVFQAPYLAIRAPGVYHIHEIKRRDGRLGGRVEVIRFSEVRHANA